MHLAGGDEGGTSNAKRERAAATKHARKTFARSKASRQGACSQHNSSRCSTEAPSTREHLPTRCNGSLLLAISSYCKQQELACCSIWEPTASHCQRQELTVCNMSLKHEPTVCTFAIAACRLQQEATAQINYYGIFLKGSKNRVM